MSFPHRVLQISLIVLVALSLFLTYYLLSLPRKMLPSAPPHPQVGAAIKTSAFSIDLPATFNTHTSSWSLRHPDGDLICVQENIVPDTDAVEWGLKTIREVSYGQYSASMSFQDGFIFFSGHDNQISAGDGENPNSTEAKRQKFVLMAETFGKAYQRHGPELESPGRPLAITPGGSVDLSALNGLDFQFFQLKSSDNTQGLSLDVKTVSVYDKMAGNPFFGIFGKHGGLRQFFRDRKFTIRSVRELPLSGHPGHETISANLETPWASRLWASANWQEGPPYDSYSKEERLIASTRRFWELTLFATGDRDQMPEKLGLWQAILPTVRINGSPE